MVEAESLKAAHDEHIPNIVVDEGSESVPEDTGNVGEISDENFGTDL